MTKDEKHLIKQLSRESLEWSFLSRQWSWELHLTARWDNNELEFSCSEILNREDRGALVKLRIGNIILLKSSTYFLHFLSPLWRFWRKAYKQYNENESKKRVAEIQNRDMTIKGLWQSKKV